MLKHLRDTALLLQLLRQTRKMEQSLSKLSENFELFLKLQLLESHRSIEEVRAANVDSKIPDSAVFGVFPTAEEIAENALIERAYVARFGVLPDPDMGLDEIMAKLESP